MEGSSSYESVRSDVRRMLDLIARSCLATFFVTGEVAENCPEIVKDISTAGHEVSCHGMWHERFDTLDKAEQSRRIGRATDRIEKCAGKRPKGFRAPQHRANAETLQVVEELDYVYDSSVLPRTPFMR
jgi:peptidoglycan/xylan/chitin deacetylase (PgdA/CDA1 family)